MGTRAPKAIVQPQVLHWLRKSSGLSINETAKKLHTKPENLIAWEAGEAQPSMPQLRNLAKAFKRPISYFYLPKPVEEPPIPHDFRRLPSAEARQYSPELLHEIRTAYRRRTFALDLAADMNARVARFDALGTVSIEDGYEDVAPRMRALIGIEIDDQKAWREPRTAYNAWREKIEALGVLVFQVISVDPQQMLGFSFAYAELPVIAINRKLKPNGRSFTMLHEFVHLLLGQSAVCDVYDDLPRDQQEQRVEVFCNYVAGAALVPKSELLAHPLVASASVQMPEWDDYTLKSLARYFGASEEVIVRRLLINGRASQEFYGRKSAQYKAWLANKAQGDSGAKKFKRNMPQEAISNLSSFARLVLDGYHSDILSLNEASRHLGVRAEKVTAVDNLVR